MVRLCNRRRSHKTPFQSKINEMVAEIKQQPAWRGDMSLIDIANLLKNEQPFTYSLSTGLDKHHYFLSYVSFDGKVKHKNIRILYANGNWIWKNGGGSVYESINPLIPYCLGCSESICNPFLR